MRTASGHPLRTSSSAGAGDVPAVSVERPTRRHRGRTGVEELTLTLARGTITGFLGPNGDQRGVLIDVGLGLGAVMRARIPTIVTTFAAPLPAVQAAAAMAAGWIATALRDIA